MPHRLLRSLVTVAGIVSLTACVAVSLLWIGGHWGPYGVTVAPAGGRVWAIGVRPEQPNVLSVASIAPWPHPAFFSTWWDEALALSCVADLNSWTPTRPRGTNGSFGPIQASWGMSDLPEARFLRNRLEPFQSGGPVPLMFAEIPCWLAATTFGTFPACWLAARAVRRGRRRERGRRNFCLACGYDLRATPERCPECGRAPAATGAV